MIREYLRWRKTRKRVERLVDVDPSTLTKEFILDSRLVEAQQLGTLLGLPEITEEDAAASEARSKKVSHLLPLVSFFAIYLSSGVMAYYDTVSPNRHELTEEEQALMRNWVATVSIGCVLGVLSQLEELELIRVVK